MFVSDTSATTDDYSDLLVSPANRDRISFKTEVAQSPSHSSESGSGESRAQIMQHMCNNINNTNNNIAGATGQDLCPCKEEVEMEEETALAQAIERSFAQQVALPHVPGLTSDEAQVVRIRCQEEVSVSLLSFAFSLIQSIYCKPVKCPATCCQSE